MAALGTNTDPYQRAEGRYALMPGILGALAASGTPFSILTKGTLLRRDLPLISDAASTVGAGVAISLAVLDPQVHRDVEPGTPTPAFSPRPHGLRLSAPCATPAWTATSRWRRCCRT